MHTSVTGPAKSPPQAGAVHLRFERGHKARSLTWLEGSLVDLAGGHATVGLDGSTKPATRDWAFDFDGALVAPSGLRVLYSSLGTKALVTNAHYPVRELNRSYYKANAFEYPLAVTELPGGQEVLAHCPEGYYRIALESLARGEPLCAASSRAADVFHSRLAFSPGGRYLLSAGWVGSPVGVAMVFGTSDALDDSSHLDGPGLLPRSAVAGSVEAACWLGPDLLAVSTSPGRPVHEEGALPPGHLGLWSFDEGAWISRARLESRTGTMHALRSQLLCLFAHPRLVDAASGRTLREWKEIDSGSQDGSVIWQLREPPPPVAIDPGHGRFAVARGDAVAVVEVD